MNTSLLVTTALILAIAHFTVPLAYYLYLKKRLNKPWDLKVDYNYTPKITIIVPTYMSARHIAMRLDNIAGQNYPVDRIEIIVVDSSSPDGTVDEVKKWIKQHPEINVKLVIEPERRGKLSAVLEGLKHVSEDSEVVVFTDDDCYWDISALRNIVKYFADPVVGAVSGSIRYSTGENIHNTYRDIFNRVRIAESKWWSTPVHNGPLLALRREVIKRIGLPILPGADDSAFASYTAFAGYRAIQVGDAWVYEFLVRGQHRRMIRRATHLIYYFTKLKKYAKEKGVYVKSAFDNIWRIEAYLHVVNPLLLLTALVLLIVNVVHGSITALALLVLGIILLSYKPYRTWITTQAILVVAAVRNLYTKDIIWEKQEK